MKIVRDTMAEAHLKAVIVRVTVDGKEVVTQAVGDSMTGVPATTNMHFRNGAVAISYVSTLLLMLVDEKKVSLDDKLSKWLPDVPHADRVTLGQLAQMTSGYVDYVIGNTELNEALLRRPVPAVDHPTSCSASRRRSRCSTSRARTGTTPTPTTSCSGMALEKATGEEMPKLLEDKVLRPLGLTNTANSFVRRDSRAGAARVHLRTARGARDPCWHTVLRGVDVLESVVDDHPRCHPDDEHLRHGGHRGRVSARASCCRRSPTTRWCRPICAARPDALPGCTTCAEMNDGYTYGMGIVISGDWLMQNPLFAG